MKPDEINTYLNTLQGSVAFQGLQPVTLDRILRKGLVLEAKQGDLIASEQMRGGIGLYVVLEGQVEVSMSRSPDADAAPVHLNTLRPGQCFGEYSLIDGQPISASARAGSASRLFFLPRGEFQQIAEQDAVDGRALYRNLLAFLIQRLREKDEALNAQR